MPAWSAASSPSSAGPIVSMTLATAVQHALAAVARLVAVAQLDRLVGAGRGARRDGRPADRAVGEDDVDLDRRIAARIEDLAGVDDVDRRCRRQSRSCRPVFARLGRRPVDPGGRRSPGSSRPSRNSSEAPPPVRDVGHLVGQALLLDRGDRVATADDDRRARVGACRRGSGPSPCVPWANDGISKTPSGPFQKTVCASARAPRPCRPGWPCPMSTMCHEAGIFSAGSVLYSVPRVTSLATMTSIGRTTAHAACSARRPGSAGRPRPGRARPGSCRPPCPGRAGTCWPCRRRGRACRPWSGGARAP